MNKEIEIALKILEIKTKKEIENIVGTKVSDNEYAFYKLGHSIGMKTVFKNPFKFLKIE